MGTLAGLILAGGKNSRMDGNKKLFLEYEGVPFYQRIARAMEGLGRVYLSVEALEPYQNLEFLLIEDRYPGIGPMGGIYSSLIAAEEEALLVLPCDTPLVERKLVDALAREYGTTGKPVFAEADGRLHPLAGIYTKAMLPTMEAMIGRGDYRMMNLIRQVDYHTWTEEACSYMLQNINDMQTYQNVQKIMNKTGIHTPGQEKR